MGRRGPAAKPSALAIVCNIDHEHTATCTPRRVKPNSKEAKPEVTFVPPPHDLSDEAKQAWNELVPLLVKYGLFTEIDPMGLAVMLESYQEGITCRTEYRKYGMTYMDDKGIIRERPEVAIGHRKFEVVRKWCAEFGLTPASRSRIQVEIATSGGQKEKEKAVDNGLFRTSNIRTA